MYLRNDLKIGDKKGRLTIKEIYFKYRENGNRERYAHCICDCGNTKEVALSHLRNGHTTSCGCYHKEQLIKRLVVHNQTNTRLHHIWEGICHRCNCNTYKRWKDYGGRGITLCEEWHDFRNFQKWAIENGYQESLSIDRIDNNGNYEPANCRWVDNLIQQNNKRNNVYYVVNGEQLTCGQISRKFGLVFESLKYFLKKEKDVTEAIKKSKKITSKKLCME